LRDVLPSYFEIELHDLDTIDGLAEAAYYSVEETPHIIGFERK